MAKRVKIQNPNEDLILASRRILAQATVDHADAIRALLELEGLDYPKLAASLTRRSAKNLTFVGQRSQSDLSEAFFTMLAYGHWDRAREIAKRVASIPKLPSGQFHSLITIVQGAYWYAFRHDDAEMMALLEPIHNDPVEYGCDVRGRNLRRPLDDPALRKQLGLDPVEGPYFDLLSPAGRPQYFLIALSQVAFMWGRGGSDDWPRDRLDEERERLEAGLRALPGMHWSPRELKSRGKGDIA